MVNTNVGLRQRSQDARVSSLGSGNMMLIHREKHWGNKVMHVCVCVCVRARETERERDRERERERDCMEQW